MSRTVRAGTLSRYVDVAAQVGLDPFALLKRVGIDAQSLRDPDMRIAARNVAELLELSAEQSGCADFSLRLAQGRKLSDLGVVTLSVLNQPTLRGVLAVMIRYRNLLNPALALHMDEIADVVDIKERLVIDLDGPLVQSHLLAVAVLFLLCRNILGSAWRPVTVHFVHARPANMTLYRAFFATHLEFGSEFYGITCLAVDLDRPNLTADSGLARYANQLLETLHDPGQQSISFEVRKSVYMLLPLGRCSIARVAGSLGMNTRTLQRRLAEQGEEFSDVVNSVRRELAERYLSNRSHSMTQIAEMLGYAQLSSYTRWFAGEFGISPLAWRQRLAARVSAAD